MNEIKITISHGINNKIGTNWNDPGCIASSTPPTCCLNCGRYLSINNNFLNSTAVSGPIQCGQLRRINEVPFLRSALCRDSPPGTDLDGGDGHAAGAKRDKNICASPSSFAVHSQTGASVGYNAWKENTVLDRVKHEALGPLDNLQLWHGCNKSQNRKWCLAAAFLSL